MMRRGIFSVAAVLLGAAVAGCVTGPDVGWEGRRVAILGDMRELGAGSVEEHQKVVDYLKESAFEQVWLVGAEFAKIRHNFRSFAHVDEVNAALDAEQPSGYYVLVKGSNGIKLFQTVSHL